MPAPQWGAQGFPGAAFPGGGAAFPASGAGRRRGWGGGARDPQATVLSLIMVLAQQVAQMQHKPPLTLALAAGVRAAAGAWLEIRMGPPASRSAYAGLHNHHPSPPCAPPRAAQVLFFLRPDGFEFLPSVRAGCLQPAAVLKGEWARLLWSPFLHADHLHLYYNLSSFLWKGAQLEPRLGPLPFLRLVAELALVSQLLYVGLAVGLRARYRALGWALTRSCAVGFSAVLFGMKASGAGPQLGARAARGSRGRGGLPCRLARAALPSATGSYGPQPPPAHPACPSPQVVLSHNSPGWSSVYGVRVPTKASRPPWRLP